MIAILPLAGEELERFRREHPDAEDVLVMTDRRARLGAVGVRVSSSVLHIVLLEADGEEPERRFLADSLLRAAASFAANRGAYRLSCALPGWEDFLKSEGFRPEDGSFVLPTDRIVNFCKH